MVQDAFVIYGTVKFNIFFFRKFLQKNIFFQKDNKNFALATTKRVDSAYEESSQKNTQLGDMPCFGQTTSVTNCSTKHKV